MYRWSNVIYLELKLVISFSFSSFVLFLNSSLGFFFTLRVTIATVTTIVCENWVEFDVHLAIISHTSAMQRSSCCVTKQKQTNK